MVELNLFKIKKYPPKTLYQLPAPPPSLKEQKSFAYANDGVLFDDFIISYKKLQNSKEIQSKTLPQHIKNQLISF
jgi:hypothetical protein